MAFGRRFSLKLLWVVAGLIFLVGVIVLSRDFTNEESLWNEYTNTEFGFSLKYPPNYRVAGPDTSPRPRISILPKEFDPGGDYPPHVDIYLPVSKDGAWNPNGRSLKDYEQDYESWPGYPVFVHFSEERIIDNKKALRQVISSGSWQIDRNGNKYFSINEWDQDNVLRYVMWDGVTQFFILRNWNANKEFEKLLDGVAESFRFTE